MAKTVQPNRKKINLVLNIALTIVAVYLLYLFIGISVQANGKSAANDELSTQISAQQIEQEKLKSVLEGEVDDKYIEKVARDRGFVNSDEQVYEWIGD